MVMKILRKFLMKRRILNFTTDSSPYPAPPLMKIPTISARFFRFRICSSQYISYCDHRLPLAYDFEFPEEDAVVAEEEDSEEVLEDGE